MVSHDPAGLVLALIALVGIGCLACLVLGSLTGVPGAGRIALATFASHVFVSSIVYANFGLFANDAQGYDQTGLAIARRLGGDTSATVAATHGKEGWVWILGVIYHLDGHWPVLGLTLNGLFAALMVPLTGLTTTRLGWAPAARRAMWIAGFAPPLFIWSTFLLREAAINLMVAISVAGCAIYLSNRRSRWLALTLLADFGLYWLRGTLTVILVGGLAAGLVMVGHLGEDRMRLRQAATLLAVAVVAVPISARVLGTFNVSLSSINTSRAALASTANTSFGAVSQSSSAAGSVLLSIKQLPIAMLGPFPWQWIGGFGGLLTAADAVTWWVFLFYVVRAWRYGPARRGRWILIAPALLLFLAIALASGNFGTLVRVRGMAVPILAPLIAVGMLTPRARRRSARGGPASQDNGAPTRTRGRVVCHRLLIPTAVLFR